MTARKTTLNTGTPEFLDAVQQAVQAVEDAKRGPAPVPRRCLGCWRNFVPNAAEGGFSAEGVCPHCYNSGHGVDFSYCLARRVNLPPNNFIPQLEIELARFAVQHGHENVRIEDLLNEDLWSEDQLCELYDQWSKKTAQGMRRMPTFTEKQRTRDAENDHKAQQKARTLKGAISGYQDQLSKYTDLLQRAQADLAALEVDSVQV